MTQAPPGQSHRLRNIIGGSAGNLVEWYDWYAYTALALYFAPAFFPSGDRTAQLLSAAAVFAVGFVMRPIGAWVMGIYADRRGRKAGLTLSVGLMCAGSLMIAVIPGYAQIGPLAPALLVLQLFLTEAQLDHWGWRIPFAIGALLALVAFYIRRRLTETESFENA